MYKKINSIDEVSSIGQIKPNCLVRADSLYAMLYIPDNSIDAIITDLPYGTTACKWDIIVPFAPMWKQLNRIIKPGGAIVLFGSEPFSSALIMSNIEGYKYSWVWNKKLAGNAVLAKKQPLKIHEDIIVFNSKIYYPIMTKGKYRKKMLSNMKKPNTLNGKCSSKETANDMYYPKSIIDFSTASMRSKKVRIQDTQKPVELIEYLINTYTKEGEVVLDFCGGSFTTTIACINTHRNFICIEKNTSHFLKGEKRVKEYLLSL